MNSLEKEIVKRLKKGDVKAFEQVYRAYYQSLVEFAQFYLDEFCAQEVVSEFFVWLWQNRQKLKIKSNLSGYLYVSIKNRALNRLTDKEKQQKEQNFQAKLVSVFEQSPEDHLINKEEAQKVENILELIPPRSRQIFIMHRYDGLKYKEIAKLLNISVNTVENHIVKAIQILRNYYRNRKN